jgi:hypothetical protein
MKEMIKEIISAPVGEVVKGITFLVATSVLLYYSILIIG